MTLLKNSLTLAVAAGALLAGGLVGCAEDAPPPVAKVAPPPPPPEPEAPKVTPIKELMARYDIDGRVNLPEERAPDNDADRIAVLKFFDAFARGNADALKPMLSGPDAVLLDGMVSRGEFSKATGATTRIDVRCGKEDGNACALAVFHVAEAFEPQLWQFTSRDESGEFEAVAAPPKIMEKLTGDDWIGVWYKEVRAELAKADEPDEVITLAQSDFTETESESAAADPGVETPSAPGGMKGKRTPGAPIDAPKAPGFGTK
ncbi:MAG: hypothetical protein LW636_05940 [Planctomycetaceae bacterium]|nr:hypothetical protein [Planctomycetaceae bacterium]